MPGETGGLEIVARVQPFQRRLAEGHLARAGFELEALEQRALDFGLVRLGGALGSEPAACAVLLVGGAPLHDVGCCTLLLTRFSMLAKIYHSCSSSSVKVAGGSTTGPPELFGW